MNALRMLAARPAGRMVATQRGFAAAAAADVQLPVQLFGLQARYANALYMSAAKAGKLEAVEKDLAVLDGWLTSTPSFSEYLQNPTISRADKVLDMAKISKGMDKNTAAFLGLLADNGRMSEIGKVLTTFRELMDAQRGIVQASVISAEALTKAEMKTVQSALKGFVKDGETITVAAKVDPAILGGLQVQIGDRFLDLSIQSKINKVHALLSQP